MRGRRFQNPIFTYIQTQQCSSTSTQVIGLTNACGVVSRSTALGTG